MIMSFDWLRDANADPEWKRQIENAMLHDEPQILFHKEIYRLLFDPLQQLVTVQPFSEDSMFSCKIMPKKFTYQLVSEVINGNWNAFSSNNIFDVIEE